MVVCVFIDIYFTFNMTLISFIFLFLLWFSDSQEDMDTSPCVPNKRIQLCYPSPLNTSPSISPLMGTPSVQLSFSTRSRKSSSTQSETTPLSSPSSLAHNNNPFAINYDSGNCEHWQSNSGSCSSCSSPSISHTTGNHKCVTGETGSLGSPRRIPGGGGGGMTVDDSHTNHYTPQGFTTGHLHSRLLSLSPSPSVVVSDEHGRGVGMQTITFSGEGGSPSSSSFDVMTETPTPLSPKGLQFRQKLFPPPNIPSPIPRPLTHSAPLSSYSSSFSSANPRGGTVAGPMSPKSHHHHPYSPSSSSLHHDKTLSPFKSELAPGRMIRAVAKKRMNQLAESMRSSVSSAGGGVTTNDYFSNSGSGSWIVNAHHPPNVNRQTINSSPLATLWMSSSLDDGGGGPGQSALCQPAAKRRQSEEDSVSRQGESSMESESEEDHCET